MCNSIPHSCRDHECSFLFFEQFLVQFPKLWKNEYIQESYKHQSNDAIEEPIHETFRSPFQENINEKWCEN